LAGLHAAGILAVVDLALNEPPTILTREMSYCRFPLIDGPGNPRWLVRAAVETTAALIRGGVATLIYCGAGMSRTPCIAGAALAMARGWPLSEGLAVVTGAGPADLSPGLWSEITSVLGPSAPESDRSEL
jgi:protein-tyrosine phosphatase